MRKNKYRPLLALLIALLIFSGLPINEHGAQTYAAEKKATMRYSFVLTPHHTWGSGSSWDKGVPGSNYSTSKTVGLGKKAVVKDIYVYDGTNFTFGENNKGIYKYNPTTYLREGYPDDYKYNFDKYTSSNIKVKNTSTNTTVETASATASFNLTYQLKSAKEFDLKYLMTRNPNYVWDLLGGKSYLYKFDRNTYDALLKAEKGSSSEGRLYFAPVIIKYYYPDEGDDPEGPDVPEDETTPGAIEVPDKNNLIMQKVVFLDENKNETTIASTKNKYYARFYVKYVGEDMTEKINLELQSGQLKNKKGGSVIYANDNWSISKNVQLKNGESTYIDIGPFYISENSIFTCATIAPNSKYNQDTTDDYGEAFIQTIPDKVNLKLKIEKVTPTSTKIYAPQTTATTNYEVQYRVDFETPADVSIDSIVRITIPSNSATDPAYYQRDEIVELEPGVNIFSIKTDDITARGTANGFNIQLEVNPTRLYPKNESTFADNVDKTYMNIDKVPLNGNNPCAAYSARTLNRWSVTYNITTGRGKNASGGCKEPAKDELPTIRTESFKIESINFTSKDSGTVNLLNSKGKIKAGYGFELNITATLSGTESPARPTPYDKGKCKKRTVYPGEFVLPTLPNYIYVVLPDGQVISNVAGTGIKDRMVCTVTKSGASFGGQTLRCNVKSGNTFGNGETNKLYVGENTADGRYKMTVCSARFASSNSKNPPLFDKRDVYFDVDGKYTDDVNTSIIQ